MEEGTWPVMEEGTWPVMEEGMWPVMEVLKSASTSSEKVYYNLKHTKIKSMA